MHHHKARLRRHAGVLCLMLASITPSARADAVVTVTDEMLFQWRLIPDAQKRIAARVCGFSITANHVSREDPKVEWDVNVDEIIQGDTKVVGVSAGTFNVAAHKRTPRSVITGLEFSADGLSDPVPIQIVGSPNPDNAVRGVIDMARSAALFDALGGPGYVTVSFRYADGTADAVRLHGHRDQDRGTKMSTLARCLRGDTPPLHDPWNPVYVTPAH